ncbi:carbamoyltransferase HypF, partial [bacterium]
MRKVLLINGIVQGVGFRPFIYRLAKRYSLKGKVRNEGKGVYIEVEGEEENIEKFLRELRLSPPPPCEITSMEEKNLPDAGYEDFVIEKSKEEEPFTFVSPDIATCKDCLRELFDPQDRRYLYPSINCTNCGPRFTIVESLPYDRERTTMRIFKMCPECEQEYNDPLSRRFHAQPNACPVCGPEVFLLYQGKRIKENAIEKACELIEKGLVVAIKGLGGFHLAVDARNPEAIKRLRERKRKNNKPFALMGNPEDIEKH